MAQELLIVGASGTGKSTSIENLPEDATFIVNVGQKALPFRKSKLKYPPWNKENPEGRMVSTDSSNDILKIFNG